MRRERSKTPVDDGDMMRMRMGTGCCIIMSVSLREEGSCHKVLSKCLQMRQLFQMNLYGRYTHNGYMEWGKV